MENGGVELIINFAFDHSLIRDSNFLFYSWLDFLEQSANLI
jgi:hypothetical protein